MNWDAMLVCGAKRAMGNNTANKPINPYKPDANAWLDGWADVLDVINSHSQVVAVNSFVSARGRRSEDAASAAALYKGELGTVCSEESHAQCQEYAGFDTGVTEHKGGRQPLVSE